jgi:hypothetical protein
MKREIYLHIGAGKTGTTAIQSFFSKYPRQEGLEYFPYGRQDKGHHGIASAILADNRYDWLKPCIKERLAEEIGSLSPSGNKKYLASSEVFSTGFFIRSGGPAALRSLFSEFDVGIIYFVRNQVDLFESTFLQVAKTGAFVGSPEEWLEHFIAWEIGSYMTVMEEYENVFGKDVIHPVNYDMVKEDILSALSKCMDIACADIRLPKLNVSSSLKSTAVLQLISRMSGERLIGPAGKRLRESVERIFPDNDDSKTIVTKEIFEYIDSKFRRQNDLLYKNYGISLLQNASVLEGEVVDWNSQAEAGDLARVILNMTTLAFGSYKEKTC